MSKARIRDWRMRAEELRVVAENMEDPVARRGMLNAAATYQAMADEAEAAARAATRSGG
jgi:hypothetical protein